MASPRPRRFPLRTLLLMVVTLLAFARMWCATHPANRPLPGAGPAPAPPEDDRVIVVPIPRPLPPPDAGRP